MLFYVVLCCFIGIKPCNKLNGKHMENTWKTHGKHGKHMEKKTWKTPGKELKFMGCEGETWLGGKVLT